MKHLLLAVLFFCVASLSSAQSKRVADGKSHLAKAKLLHNSAQLSHAESHLDTAIAYAPLLSESYLLRGLIHEEQNDYRSAIIDYRSLVTIESEHKEGWFALANAFYESGSYKDALASYEELISIPDDGETALIYYDLDVNNNTTGISSQAGMSKIVYDQMGLCLVKLDMYSEAEEYFNKAISLDSLYSDAWINLGMVSEHKMDHQSAMKYYIKALEADPTNEEAQYNYTRLLPEENRLSSLNQLIESGSRVSFLYNERGLMWLESEEYFKAKLDFLEACKMDSSNYKFWFHLGLSYSGLQKFDSSVLAFDRSILLNPAFYKALSAKGNMYHKSGNYRTAIDLYSQALKLDAENANVFYNRGVSFYSLGHKQLACSDFENAANLGLAVAQTALRSSCQEQ
ncbi:MAG: tetratricopeptide repeat protein [Bacteroidota bacterium]